ncbi:MAG: SF1B family DNA helicase RecD2 [Candidatus Zipacnadales bacterium]
MVASLHGRAAGFCVLARREGDLLEERRRLRGKLPETIELERANGLEEALDGVIEGIIYHGEDTGFTVCRISVPGMTQMVTAVGPFTSPVVGESVRLHGEWQQHPRFGMQFRFERYETLRPATVQAIEKYLGSGLIRGIGPQMAKRLVRHFGEHTLDVLDADPDRVLEVEGIGPKRARMIRDAWLEQKAIQNVMLFLQGHAVSAAYAAKIYRAYGDDAIRIVEQDPYRLARDIWGIGFRTADRIAMSVGIPHDAPKRLAAGLEHVLLEATNEGHTYLPREYLIRRAAEVLEVDQSQVCEVLDECLQARGTGKRLEQETGVDGVEGIFLAYLAWTEREVATQVRRLLATPPPRAPSPEHTLRWLERTRQRRGVELSRQQVHAVVEALRQPMLVITGGPGTGKTTITRTIVEAGEALNRRLALASPTGRAAKRLAEVTGRPAKTIHRLLEVDPQTWSFKHGPDNPLDIDFLIVDEVSMLEVALARDLLRALPNACQVILVGDADQLPAVGPGSVLADIIRCGVVPVCRLTEVFRQAQQSMIVRSAHNVHRGRFVEAVAFDEWDDENCVFVEETEAQAIPEQVARLVAEVLPARGYSPAEIQVIAPLYRGAAGVSRLNEVLQQRLNPPAPGRPELRKGGRILRAGDRVLQLVNDYEKQVFNGDIGVISSIDTVQQLLHVAYPDCLVYYDFAETDQLQLAYALTVHKSQGSEYDVVVLVLHRTHHIMLQRNLLYTGLTRARELLVIVGDKKALWRGVRNDQQTLRWSRLADRLAGRLPGNEIQPKLIL